MATTKNNDNVVDAVDVVDADDVVVLSTGRSVAKWRLIMAGGRICKYALAVSACTDKFIPDDGQYV